MNTFEVNKFTVQYSYVVVGNQDVDGVNLECISNIFPNYRYCGSFENNLKSIEQLIKLKPHLLFIYIVPENLESTLTFDVLSEMFQYFSYIPYLVALYRTTNFAYQAIQCGFSDYLTTTDIHSLGKALTRFEKKVPEVYQHSFCIRSYSEYHILKFCDIVFLKADNNSTDFKLINGKIITAFKTLKHFENAMPVNFVRIHKSYIVNIHYVSRIQFGKNKCFLNFNEEIPFSNSYRSDLEVVLAQNGINI